MPSRFLLLLILSVVTVSAESRPWKSADGRTLRAEFVNRDATSVTLMTDTGKKIIIRLSALDPEETRWLDTHHPLTTPEAASVPNPAAVFDTLLLGDDRATVTKKLKASKVVELTTDEAFLGRSGLNGVYFTRQAIGKVKASLYFDWTAEDKLKEITLQTELLPGSEYETELKPTWEAFVELLGALYGKPVQKGPLPSKASLTDGMFFPSHLWALHGNNSALLGASCTGNRYQLVVRFTGKTIKPVEIP